MVWDEFMSRMRCGVGPEIETAATPLESNKGFEDGQFNGRFAQRRHAVQRNGVDRETQPSGAGTRVSIQGGASSAMSRNFRAVLLAGIPLNKAPRRT